MSAPLPQDPNAEREIDLRAVWTRISARWWIPVAGLVLGAVLGVLASVGGGATYSAHTLLYLGQPFTPGGGGQIQSLATNPKTVDAIIRSEAALRRAAAASGLTVAELRGNVTSEVVVAAGQIKSTSPLVNIIVNAKAARRAEVAANTLSQTVVDSVSTYVDRKIALLHKQTISSTAELADINARVSAAVAEQQNLISSKNLTPTDKLIAISAINNTLNFSEQRRGTVQQALYLNQQLLSLAQNVEKSNIVQPAVAAETTATSHRNAAVIGALIGLLLGVLLAAVLDPILQRRNAQSAA